VQELVHLPIARFTTPQGKRTCCLNVEAKQTCPLLATYGLKSVDVCTWAELHDKGRSGGQLFRDRHTDGTPELGYLVPHKLCPLKDLTATG
jgi:hypothetical protein